MLTHVSLFSGIGGFDRAAELTGFTTVLCAESDVHCRAVLHRHWPDVPILDDVRKVDGSINADIISGGFPCQDISVAGCRAGLAGERSGLWHEFARIIADVRPAWVLVENVAGLLSSNRGRDMGAILGALADLGYGYTYRVLDAQFFGVAQRRRRVFIVGCLGDVRRAAAVLLEPEGLCWNPPQGGEARKAVADTLSSRAGSSGDYDGSGRYIAGTLGGGSGNRGWSSDTERMTFVKGRRAHSDDDYETWRQERVSPTLNAFENDSDARATVVVAGTVSCKWAKGSGGPAGDEAQNLVVASALTSSAGHHGHSSPRGDGADNLVAAFSAGQGSAAGGIGYHAEQSPTLKASASGTNSVPTLLEGASVRRLTPTECERLQGFPDGWTEGHSDSQRYKMLGNAVAVPVAEWILRRVADMEGR